MLPFHARDTTRVSTATALTDFKHHQLRHRVEGAKALHRSSDRFAAGLALLGQGRPRKGKAKRHSAAPKPVELTEAFPTSNHSAAPRPVTLPARGEEFPPASNHSTRNLVLTRAKQPPAVQRSRSRREASMAEARTPSGTSVVVVPPRRSSVRRSSVQRSRQYKGATPTVHFEDLSVEGVRQSRRKVASALVLFDGGGDDNDDDDGSDSSDSGTDSGGETPSSEEPWQEFIKQAQKQVKEEVASELRHSDAKHTADCQHALDEWNPTHDDENAYRDDSGNLDTKDVMVLLNDKERKAYLGRMRDPSTHSPVTGPAVEPTDARDADDEVGETKSRKKKKKKKREKGSKSHRHMRRLSDAWSRYLGQDEEFFEHFNYRLKAKAPKGEEEPDNDDQAKLQLKSAAVPAWQAQARARKMRIRRMSGAMGSMHPTRREDAEEDRLDEIIEGDEASTLASPNNSSRSLWAPNLDRDLTF